MKVPSHNSHSNIENQIHPLNILNNKLLCTNDISEKLKILIAEKDVQLFLKEHASLNLFLQTCQPEEKLTVYSLIAIGQAPIVLNNKIQETPSSSHLKQLLTTLTEIECFYKQIGGIIGYHLAVIELIASHEKKQADTDLNTTYRRPEGLDLTQNSDAIDEIISWGIQSIPHIAEIYPVGGAGDRLDLHAGDSDEPLPAAMLSFEGRSLLEGLIRDVQAKEYLYYKFFGKQVTIPIAMMTSHEKANHDHIQDLCKKHQRFNRPLNSFFFFIQPLVPVITKEGNWSMSTPFKLMLKPGGHGVIWKVAKDQGVFHWLNKLGKHHAIIRQINNPIAGTDNTLLALAGIGHKENKAFGFISCERLLNSSEGMNVLKERKTDDGYDYCISNIEYTDISLKGLEEKPSAPGSTYSEYPANINALFADLNAVEQCLTQCSFPGS